MRSIVALLTLLFVIGLTVFMVVSFAKNLPDGPQKKMYILMVAGIGCLTISLVGKILTLIL